MQPLAKLSDLLSKFKTHSIGYYLLSLRLPLFSYFTSRITHFKARWDEKKNWESMSHTCPKHHGPFRDGIQGSYSPWFFQVFKTTIFIWYFFITVFDDLRSQWCFLKNSSFKNLEKSGRVRTLKYKASKYGKREKNVKWIISGRQK